MLHTLLLLLLLLLLYSELTAV